LKNLLHYKNQRIFEINFDSVFATKTLDYIVVNNGTADAINLNFSSDILEISPTTIKSIPGTDSTFVIYPIISFSMLHVLPTSGVGSLLPFSLGEVNGQVFLNYSYIDPQNDTILVDMNYVTRGTKYGEIINILSSGTPIELIAESKWIGQAGNFTEDVIVYSLGANPNLSSFIISNDGNLISNILITTQDLWENQGQQFVHSMQLQPLQSLDITNVFQLGSAPLIKVGPSNGIIKFTDEIILNGEQWMMIDWIE